MKESGAWKGSGAETVCVVGTGLMLAPVLMALTLGVLSRTIVAALPEQVWAGASASIMQQGVFVFYLGASLWFAKMIHSAARRAWRRSGAASRCDRADAYLTQVLEKRGLG